MIDEAELRLAVEQAYEHIGKDEQADMTPRIADRALVHTFECIEMMREKIDESERALQFYRDTYQGGEKGMPDKLAAAEKLADVAMKTRDLFEYRCQELERKLNQRGSSQAWEKIRLDWIMKGKPIPDNVVDFVQSLMARIAQEKADPKEVH